ncbi:MAG: hypothetical protein QNJ30_00015 [Kiloniellales bacterium]|nr:hypothetical protein [Kiloniellales bacterium]
MRNFAGFCSVLVFGTTLGIGLADPSATRAQDYYTKKFESFPQCCRVLREHSKQMGAEGKLATKVVDNQALFVGMTFEGLPKVYTCTPTADGGGILGSSHANTDLGLAPIE